MKQWRGTVVMQLMLVAGTIVPISAFEDPPAPPDRQTNVASYRGVNRSAQPGQSFRDVDLGVDFDVVPLADGGAEIRVAAGPLSVVKTIRSDGSTTRLVRWQHDVVTITNDAAGVVVERGGRRAAWRAGEASEEATDAVRNLLAASPAVRALRRLGTAVEQRGLENSFFAVSTLLDSAFVALLDGDELAVRRFGERVTERARSRNRRGPGQGLVPAALGPQSRTQPVQFRDCLGEMYDYVGRSWGQYRQCEGWALNDPWYQRCLHIMWCQREFEIRMASGLLQFVQCSGIG